MAFLDKAGLERLWAHIVSLVGTKVEKVEGKGLSTEDFTTEEKEKLAHITDYVDEAIANIDTNVTVAKITDLTATATELNYMDGVTSNVQTQLDTKVPINRTINGKALSSNITLSASDVGAYSKAEIDGYMEYFTNNMPEEIMYVTGTVQDDGSVTIDKTLADITQAAVIDMKVVYALLVINNTEMFILPLTVFEPNQLAIFARTVDGDTIALLVDESGAAFAQMEGVTKEDLDTHIDDKNNPHSVTASQIGAYTKAEVNNLLNNIEHPEEIMYVTATMQDDGSITVDKTLSEITQAAISMTAVYAIGVLRGAIHVLPLAALVPDAMAKFALTANKEYAIITVTAAGVTFEIGEFLYKEDLDTHVDNKNNPHNVTASQLGLGNVENKSSATIRGELTKENVTTALGYTPPESSIGESGTGNNSEIFNSYTDRDDTHRANVASGGYSHAEGCSTEASSIYAHAEGYQTTANNQSSHAEGTKTTAAGGMSHAEGSSTNKALDFVTLPTDVDNLLSIWNTNRFTLASGMYSHAEGSDTLALGNSAHSEGSQTRATGSYSHSEGFYTEASGTHSHAEGHSTTASNDSSHAEGYNTKAKGLYAHAEGFNAKAEEEASHAEGVSTSAYGKYAHVEGESSVASGQSSHAEGRETMASGQSSHAEGSETKALSNSAHAEGYQTTASGSYSHAEGSSTKASGTNSHAEGYNTRAMGDNSHAEGRGAVVPDTITSTTDDETIIAEWNTAKFSLAKGEGSHVEGKLNLALGSSSHAEGSSTIASGMASHAEGNFTVASEWGAHAEGVSTVASSAKSHAEGWQSKAAGIASHAEGNYTTASGASSHAEGQRSTASGEASHAEGYYTKASSEYQHVQGKYNIEDNSNIYAHIVGNGFVTYNEAENANYTTLSNAHTLDWNGNAWFSGDVYVGGTNQNDGAKLTTEADFHTALNRTTPVTAADTNYAEYKARGVSLNNTETTPTVNGAIAWIYE